MVARMDAEGFGSCTNHEECEAACPKGVSTLFIARMNRDFLQAQLEDGRRAAQVGEGGV
jgi:succinate dehydrogenase / fumarate reductase iron-sulfur subunit